MDVATPAWKRISDPRLGLADAIDEQIAELEQAHPGLLPNLRNASTLLIASDYSGELRPAAYQTLSFLIVDEDRIHWWDKARRRLRSKFLVGNRTMSFKGLNDERKWRALEPFLLAADELTGVLVTFAVRSSVATFFPGSAPLDLTSPAYAKYQHWNPRTLEKLFRILHFLSLLLGGLASPAQQLRWVTDHDAITANEQHLVELGELLDHVLAVYISDAPGVEYNTLKRVDESSRILADLVAIPDLAAGALAEIAPLHGRQGIVVVRPVGHIVPADVSMSRLFRASQRVHVVAQKGAQGILEPVGNIQAKIACIINWLGRRAGKLAHMVCMIDPGDDATHVCVATFTLFSPGHHTAGLDGPERSPAATGL